MSKVSKFLSLVLRHQPDKAAIALDRHGWASIDDLIKGVSQQFDGFNIDQLMEIIETNDKKRFELDITGTMIRACQGHSVDVDLQLKPMTPPAILYHGTAVENIDSIFTTGINSGSRHAVQLSELVGTAFEVGARHGTPVVITVLAEEMHNAGHVFTQSTNGVWLTDFVPREFLGIVRSNQRNLKKTLDRSKQG